jgi:hypothetical protein
MSLSIIKHHTINRCGNTAVRLPTLLTRALNTTETRSKDPRSHVRAAMRLPLRHNGATGVE